jgi:hypothetical protein
MQQSGSKLTLEKLTQFRKQPYSIGPIDEGTKIDCSEEQSANADLPKRETREPDSNVTVERALHLVKQDLDSLLMDDGRQIDCSDEQSANAYSPRFAILLPHSNLTDAIELRKRKHPAETVSMVLPIVTFRSLPKYQTRQIPRESTRKSSETVKNGFSGSTLTVSICECCTAKPETSRTRGGIESERSDAHFSNAPAPKSDIREPDANTKSDRQLQWAKHALGSF